MKEGTLSSSSLTKRVADFMKPTHPLNWKEPFEKLRETLMASTS